MTMWRSATCAILFALLLSLGATAQAQDQSSANAAASSVISGRVTTREGEPLTNARVSIGRLNTTLNIAVNSQTLRVDSGGTFKSAALEPGLYWLGVYAPGYITDTSQRPTSSGFYRPGDNATFTMIKGGVITGTVKNSNNEPVIAIQVRAIAFEILRANHCNLLPHRVNGPQTIVEFIDCMVCLPACTLFLPVARRDQPGA